MHLTEHRRFNTAADIATEVAAGTPDAEVEVTNEMAKAGARVLAAHFEHAYVNDWLTLDRASEIYQAMWSYRES
jgi:hypothetical protein